MPSNKKWLIALIGVLISLLAIYSILTQIDFERLVEAFRTARYAYVLPCVILILLGLAARGVRWRVLLNYEISTIRAFNIMNVAYMVNGVVPLRLGELARAYLASQASKTVPMARAISTIVVERILDVIAVLVILGIAIASAPVPETLRGIAAAATPTVIIGFLALIAMSRWRKPAMRFVSSVSARLVIFQRLKIAEVAGHFLDGLTPLTQPATLIKVLLWTGLAWGFSLVSGYLLMPAFFDAPDWVATCLFSAAASFANALPAAPASLGTYEYSILISFQALEYPDAAAITGFAVMIHALNIGLNVLLGVFGFLQEGITLNQLSEQVKGIEQPSTR
jgi:uncharacterized protein (TIRG00374 family)